MRQIAVLNDEPYPRVGELRRLQRPSGLLDRYVPAQLIRRQFRNKLVKSDWVFVIFWPRRPELSGGVEPTGECRQTLAGHTDAVLAQRGRLQRRHDGGVGVGGQDRPRLGPHDGGVPSNLCGAHGWGAQRGCLERLIYD